MSDESSDPTPDHSDVEDSVETTHDRAVEEGADRLHRSWPVLLTTGFLGGVEITVGLLAYLLTLHETGSAMLAGLAFSIGLIALFLAHSELFTEGFYYPITAIAAGQGTVLDLLRLWSVTFLTNLVGGGLTVGLVVLAFPKLHETIGSSAHHFLEVGLSWQGASLAFLAGTVITLMTRMHAGTESTGATIAASVGGAVLLAGGSLFHSVLDSVILFGAIFAGVGDVTVLDWLGWIWWVVPLNILGGLLLTTAPRLLRSSEVRKDRGETAGGH